ncbi:MAG: acyl-CoA dehydrogenase family protein [Halobacteria archaeon]
MVDFELPKSLGQMRGLISQLAIHKLRPVAREWDEKEHEVPWPIVNEVHKMMKAMGASALGGTGVRAKGASKGGKEGNGESKGESMGTLSGAILAEALTYGDAGLALCMPGPQLGGAAIMAAGTPAQKEKWLSRFPGEKPTWGAMSITEPGSGSDTASIRTTARKEGNRWILNGEKIFVTSGQLALEKSDGLVVVWARVLPPGVKAIEQVEGHAAMRAFIVPAGTRGIKVAKVEKKLGIRASNTVSLVLEDCAIPLENLLGEPILDTHGSASQPSGASLRDAPAPKEAKGFKGVMATFDSTRPIVASFAIGVAQAALDFTKEMLKKQGIQLRYGLSPARVSAAEQDVMKMEAELQAARLLAWRASWMMDRKQPNALEAAMAKGKAGTAATNACLKCSEICGWFGYSRKHLLEKWIRDVKINDIYEGTGQIQLLIMARRVLGYTREQLK